MNDEEYKEYIYDNIKTNINHCHIINMIKENKCNYTENKNGFFINLNDIDSIPLKNIYEIIKTHDKKNNVNNLNDIIKNNFRNELNESYRSKKELPNPIKKDIYIDELNKEIINFIKQI